MERLYIVTPAERHHCVMLICDLKCRQMSEFEQEVRSQPAIAILALAPGSSDQTSAASAAAWRQIAGCGTSFFMAQAVACLRESRGAGEADPFTASDAPLGRAYDAVVVLSRSGTTTEVVRLQRALP